MSATVQGTPRGAGDVDAIIALAGPALADRMTRAEQRLHEIAAEVGEPLGSQARVTVAVGGKRLRPLLVLLAAEAAGGAPAGSARDGALVRAAVAVELVHGATLVHDDVLDGADLRRGRATVVAAAGRAVAVATGDLLFARAFAELARNGSAAALRALSDASSALAEGELLQRADAYDVAVELERYLRRCEMKTAALFEAACRLGALAAVDAAPDGLDGAVADRLAAFARRIGLAFQLLDDVLDVSGPASRTGKHRGTDLLDGTVTLPLILARERDRELATLDLRALDGPATAEHVCDRIAATGALADAKQQALAIVAGAKRALPDGLPARQRQLLELVADGVVERYG
jgi:geranylgeranyl pyrophosphate synthase